MIRWFENKWPINKICIIRILSKLESWHICKENAHNKKIAERKLRDSRLPYSINQNHIDKATAFLKSNSINKVSVEDVRTYLLSEKQGGKLSKTGVHYLMTKILRYSYKKAHKIMENGNRRKGKGFHWISIPADIFRTRGIQNDLLGRVSC